MTVFDQLAPTYDQDFSVSPIATYLRQRVHKRLLMHFDSGDHILELGCGTGDDAIFLAQHGITVTATDNSPAMLAQTQQKTRYISQVTTQQFDLNNPKWDDADMFAGVFSNFGALNCVVDRYPLVQWLADHTTKGAIIGLGVMAPYCAWEFAWHALHFDWNIALRRLRGSTFQPHGTNNAIHINYPSVHQICTEFAPYFQLRYAMPLGLLLPPTALFPVIEKRPSWLRILMKIEDHLPASKILALFADHYWIELERL